MRTDLCLQAPDGAKLGGVRWQPSGAPRGVVVLMHAMMVDHRSMDRGERGLAAFLVGRGWEVWLVDARGRGRSNGPRDWSYDDLVQIDTPTVIHAARRASAGRPVVLVGHSLGGHVSAATIASGGPSPDAWVGVAANIWAPGDESRPHLRLAKGAVLAAFEGVAGLFGRFPSRLLGVGPADEAPTYIRDLRRPWVSGRWRDLGGRVAWDAGTAPFPPALSVLGAGDVLLGRPDGAAAWATRCVPGVELWTVGDGRYDVAGRPGHMGLITDPEAAGWWNHLDLWLQDRLGA